MSAANTSPELGARDFASLLVVVIIWGVNFVVMKIGLAYFTPMQMGAGRFIFAFLPLALVLRRPGAHPGWIMAFGLAQGLGQFGLLFLALRTGMSAALASVLLQTHIFFSAGLAWLLLGERVGKPLKIGMAIALPGLAFFGASVLTSSSTGGVTALGLTLTIAAAASWALSNIVVRFAQRGRSNFNATSFVAWSSATSIFPFLGASWWLDPPGAAMNWVNAPWQGWLVLAFLGWMATNLGYGLWTGLLKRFSAARIAPFSLGVPVIGLVMGIVILGESVTPLQWAGAGCLVCALLCVVFGPRWMASAKPAAQSRRQ